MKWLFLSFQVVPPQHHRRGGGEPAADPGGGRQLLSPTQQEQPGRLHPLSAVRGAFRFMLPQQ